MIFLSLHYGGPHANPAKRVVWGEGGTTEWSGCPPSGGRSGVEFVPTRRRRRRLKRTSANAPVLTGVWGRSATNKHAPVYTSALLAATNSTYYPKQGTDCPLASNAVPPFHFHHKHS